MTSDFDLKGKARAMEFKIPDDSTSMEYRELYEAYEKLTLELEFTKKYLDPMDTSFRDMMDTFYHLPHDKKYKLINLAQALADLASEK